MILPRFSIRTLVIVTTLVAVGAAAITSGRPLLASAAYTLNWLLLSMSLAASLVVPDERRYFWIGFATVAWSYTFFGTENVPNQNRSTVNSGWSYNASNVKVERSDRLITGALIDYLETRINYGLSIGDEVVAQYNNGGYYPGVIDDVGDGTYLIRWTDGSSSPDQWTLPSQILPGTTSYRVAAHSVMCSLWGVVGGILALLLGVRKKVCKTNDPAGREPMTEGSGPMAESREPAGNADSRKSEAPAVE